MPKFFLVFELSFVLSSICVHLSTTVNLEDKRELFFTECRRSKWKGDIAETNLDKIMSPVHPKNLLKVRSRKKRFISFPEGSALTLRSSFRLPQYSNEWKALNLYIGFPLFLELPTGPLKITGKIPNDLEEEEQIKVGHPNYFDDQYMKEYYDKHHSLDSQRKKGYDVIETILENLGLPGRICLMKVICEAAEEPLQYSGILGEILHLFLAAGYGEGSEEMKPFINAEESGRQIGDCDSLFPECPLSPSEFLESGLSIFHSGLSSI